MLAGHKNKRPHDRDRLEIQRLLGLVFESLTHHLSARQYALTTSFPIHCAPHESHLTSHESGFATCSPELSQTHAVTAGMRLPSSPGVYLLPHDEHGCMSGLRGRGGSMVRLMSSIQSSVT